MGSSLPAGPQSLVTDARTRNDHGFLIHLQLSTDTNFLVNLHVWTPTPTLEQEEYNEEDTKDEDDDEEVRTPPHSLNHGQPSLILQPALPHAHSLLQQPAFPHPLSLSLQHQIILIHFLSYSSQLFLTYSLSPPAANSFVMAVHT
jgi:hypothetical protein